MTLDEKFKIFYEELVKITPEKEHVSFTPYCGETTLFSSKLGGKPYFPRNMEYPKSTYKDRENIPLSLLAQINFTEFPHIKGFPDKGIMQFFIDSSEQGTWGMNFDDHLDQSGFRVIYHGEILPESGIFSEDELPDFAENDLMPFSGTYALKFGALEVSVPLETDGGVDAACSDIYNRLFGKNGTIIQGKYDDITDDEEFYEKICSELFKDGSRVGGYPYFTQLDPRTMKEEYESCDTLLLQIDSEFELDIMWGDCGVANFFIAREDLEKRDFSRVLYTMDCL